MRFGTQTPHLNAKKPAEGIFEIFVGAWVTGSLGLHTLQWHGLKVIFLGVWYKNGPPQNWIWHRVCFLRMVPLLSTAKARGLLQTA